MSQQPPADFTSAANRAHVAQLARRFLFDKFRWTPPPQLQFEKMVVDVMQSFAKATSGPGGSHNHNLSELNKMVIGRIRAMVIPPDPVSLPPSPPASAQPPLPAPPPFMERGTSERHHDTLDADAEDRDDEESDNSFMERLQELEAQRKAIPLVAPNPPAPAATQVPTQAPPPPPQQQQQQQAPPPQRIYMSAPPTKPGVPVIIHGWHRNVAEWPDRATFAWNGPIPTSIDKTSLRVAVAMFPKSLSATDPTPYVRMRIEGAGRQSCECILVPAVAPGQNQYKPASPALGQLVALGLPWTVRFFNAEGHALGIGRDATRVHCAWVMGEGALPKIVLEFAPQPKDHCIAEMGDILHIHKTNGEVLRATTVAKTPSGLLVEGPAGPEDLAEALVVNITQQPVVIFEASTVVTSSV